MGRTCSRGLLPLQRCLRRATITVGGSFLKPALKLRCRFNWLRHYFLLVPRFSASGMKKSAAELYRKQSLSFLFGSCQSAKTSLSSFLSGASRKPFGACKGRVLASVRTLLIMVEASPRVWCFAFLDLIDGVVEFLHHEARHRGRCVELLVKLREHVCHVLSVVLVGATLVLRVSGGLSCVG